MAVASRLGRGQSTRCGWRLSVAPFLLLSPLHALRRLHVVHCLLLHLHITLRRSSSFRLALLFDFLLDRRRRSCLRSSRRRSRPRAAFVLRIKVHLPVILHLPLWRTPGLTRTSAPLPRPPLILPPLPVSVPVSIPLRVALLVSSPRRSGSEVQFSPRRLPTSTPTWSMARVSSVIVSASFEVPVAFSSPLPFSLSFPLPLNLSFSLPLLFPIPLSFKLTFPLPLPFPL